MLKPFELLYLKLHNFGSYFGKHTIYFQNGLTLIRAEILDSNGLMDSNSGGKTTLLNAIAWCLWGKTVSGLKAEDLVHDGCREMSVEVGFDSFRVQRSKGKKLGLKVITDDDAWQGSMEDDNEDKIGDIPVIQKKLEDLLGMNFQLYCAAVHIERSSKASQFVEANPTDRAKILQHLIDDTLFVKGASLIQQDLAELDQRLDLGNQQVHDCDRRLAMLKTQKAEYEASLADIKEAWQVRKQQLLTQLAKIKDKLTEVQMTLLQKPPRSMAQLEEQRRVLQKRLSEKEREYRDLGVIRMPRIDSGENCPTCMRLITPKDLENCRAEVANVQAKAKEARDERDDLARMVEKIDEEMRKVRKLKAERERAQESFELYQTEKARIEEDLEHPPVGSEGLKRSLGNIKLKIEEVKQEHDKIQLKLGALLIRKDKLAPLLSGFKTEIRNLLFDKVRDNLHHYTKYYLRQFHGGNITVDYPSTSKTSKEKFEIEVCKAGRRRKLKTFSQGENVRIAYSVLLALRATMLESTSTRLRLLFIDDPFGGLDRSGIPRLVEFLQTVSQDADDVSNLLITTPIDLAQGFDQIITVEKEDDLSRIRQEG